MKYLIMSALLLDICYEEEGSFLIVSQKKFILGLSLRQVEIRSHLVCRIISATGLCLFKTIMLQTTFLH
jgi:hypothetical protein